MKVKVIHTFVTRVAVRSNYNFDLMCEKWFFDAKKAIEFKNEIEAHITGVEVIMKQISCEDSIIYERESEYTK